MIDKKLYCETFSHLRASEEAKKEVFHMREQTHRWIPKILRAAAIAAAMTCAARGELKIHLKEAEGL